MNKDIPQTLIEALDLKKSISYALVHICYELSYTNLFYKRVTCKDIILEHFNFIFNYSEHTKIFVHNILNILLTTLDTYIDGPTNTYNYDIHMIIDMYDILFKNKTTASIILQSVLLPNILDKLLLYVHYIFEKKLNYCNIILKKLSDIFISIGFVHIKHYISNKIQLYIKLELNTIHFKKDICNDYKIMLSCTHILSYYLISNKVIYVPSNNIFSIYNTHNVKVNIYKDTVSNMIHDTHDGDNKENSVTDKDGIYACLLKLYYLIIMPLHEKLKQMRDDMILVNRSITDIGNRYAYTNIYNHIFLRSLTKHKNEIETTYNSFFYIINNDLYIKNVVYILNNIYKHILTHKISLDVYIIEFSITFCKNFCYSNIHTSNIHTFKYIIIGLLNILHNDTPNINIYMKYLIVDIVAFNRKSIIQLFQNEYNGQLQSHFLQSLLHIYKRVELNKAYIPEEKVLLRNNIHIIFNYYISKLQENQKETICNNTDNEQLNINTLNRTQYLNDLHLSSMFFLLFQDANNYFEYIIYFIKYRASITTKIHNYSIYFKESISLIYNILQYNKQLLYSHNIVNMLVTNFNTYLNVVLNSETKYIYFNFSNLNIHFSWKLDLLEKINNIYGLYKDDEQFCKALLLDNSNYNSSDLKQLELFLDNIITTEHASQNVSEYVSDYISSNNIYANNSIEYKTDIDILIKNVDTYKNNTTISNIDPSKIPSHFLDPILMSVINEPIILPDSNIIVDKQMILKHLLINKKDPFTLQYLDEDILHAHNEIPQIIERIHTFKKEYQIFVDNF